MSELQKCAEILVECGYEGCDAVCKNCVSHVAVTFLEGSGAITINPFSDTLEGRRQADAIEDWLKRDIGLSEFKLWVRSGQETNCGKSCHQWRLDRIKYCIGELIKCR